MLNTNRIDKHVSSCLLFMPINSCSNDSINSISLPALASYHHHERLNNDNNSISIDPNTSLMVDSSVAAINLSSSIASISVQRDDIQHYSDNNESTSTGSNNSSLLGSIITHQRRGSFGVGDDSDEDDNIFLTSRNSDLPRFIDVNVSNKRSKNDTSYIQLCFDPINNAMATEWVGQPRLCTANVSPNSNQSTSPTEQQKVEQEDTYVSLTQNNNLALEEERSDSTKGIECKTTAISSTFVFGSFDPFSFDDGVLCESNDCNNDNDIVPKEWVFKEFDPISQFTNIQQQQQIKKRGHATINNNNNNNKNKNKSKRTTTNRHMHTRRFCSTIDIVDNDSTSMTSETKSQDCDDESNPLKNQSNNNHNNWAQWGTAFLASSLHTSDDTNGMNDTSNSNNNNDMKFVNENWFVDLSDIVGDTLLLLSSSSSKHDKVKYYNDDDYTTTTTTRNDSSYYNMHYDITKTSSSCASGLSCIRSITTIFVSNDNKNNYDDYDHNNNKLYYTPPPIHKIYNPIMQRPTKSSNRYATSTKVDRTITAKYSKLSFG